MDAAENQGDLTLSAEDRNPKGLGFFRTLIVPILKAAFAVLGVGIVAPMGVYAWGAYCQCGQDSEALVDGLAKTPWWNLLLSLIFGGFAIWDIERRGRLRDGCRLAGLLRPAPLPALLIGLVAGGLAALLAWWGMNPGRGYSLLHVSFRIQGNIASICSLAFFIPLIEEIYFRGFMTNFFLKSGGLFRAVAVTTALFTACHAYFFIATSAYAASVGLVGVCVVGIACSCLYLRYRSLWAGVLFHGTYNFILIALDG